MKQARPRRRSGQQCRFCLLPVVALGRTAALARAAGTPPTATRELPRPLRQAPELAQAPPSSACLEGCSWEDLGRRS